MLSTVLTLHVSMVDVDRQLRRRRTSALLACATKPRHCSCPVINRLEKVVTYRKFSSCKDSSRRPCIAKELEGLVASQFTRRTVRKRDEAGLLVAPAGQQWNWIRYSPVVLVFDASRAQGLDAS
jgi:hypothetical protein